MQCHSEMKFTDLSKLLTGIFASLDIRFELLKQPLFSKLNVYWEDYMEEYAYWFAVGAVLAGVKTKLALVNSYPGYTEMASVWKDMVSEVIYFSKCVSGKNKPKFLKQAVSLLIECNTRKTKSLKAKTVSYRGFCFPFEISAVGDKNKKTKKKTPILLNKV